MDGIPEKRDKCPDTPPGLAVDENGCPLDSDNDGVPDYQDDCPDEPGDFKHFGCPDADEDGISDSKDRCPDTPKGCYAVDANGCPYDTDGDGVIDCEDKCPDNPGAASNQGCPDLLEAESGLPYLPDRMPEPSDKIVLNDSFFQNCKTLDDFETKLTTALEANGYSQPGFFLAGNQGFALATPLEQTFKDGESKPDPYRWSLEDTPRFLKGFSLSEYFDLLFNGAPGFYRSFVFIVSNQQTQFEKKELTVNNVSDLVDNGANWLPPEVLDQPADPNHFKCLCLVYYFKKDGVNNEISLMGRDLKCKVHLEKSGIWEKLEKE